MYISNRIEWKRRLDLETDGTECIFAKIFQNKTKILLWDHYIGPRKVLDIYIKTSANPLTQF